VYARCLGFYECEEKTMSGSTQDKDKHTRFEGIVLDGVSRLDEIHADFDNRVLLHAGPPFVSGDIPTPVRNSAINALLFEGLATTSAEADDLISNGNIDLQPAQNWNVTTPLAQVVSASMPLFAISDGENRAYSPLLEGAPPALRFGSPDAVCLDNLRLHASFAQVELIKSLQGKPVCLATVIRIALSEGNECHTLTDRANAALLDRFQGLSDEYRDLLASTPGFVLPVLMGACRCLLKKGKGSVEAVGGNGQDFGVRLRGQSDWLTVPARVPDGPRITGKADQPSLPAIGDSAVIDFCGLGGQALESAPTLVEEWQAFLPKSWASRSETVLDPDTGKVCPSRVNRYQTPPIINLAIVGAGSRGGILGKGFYQPDLGLFREIEGGIAS
jgi:hypothetical protein